MPQITLENIIIEIELKRIRNINIRISAPSGDVKISAPQRMSMKKIHDFALSKLNWIKKHQNEIRSRKREEPKEYKDGELHNFLGKQYELELIEENKKPQVRFAENKLILRIRPHFTKKQKEKLVQEWYRAQLKSMVAELIKKYEEEMKVKVAEFGIKNMKTRWGTCSIRARRIWISLELAKRPFECLENIVVHEMVHLLERKHNKRFYALMDKFLPTWREGREKLRS